MTKIEATTWSRDDLVRLILDLENRFWDGRDQLPTRGSTKFGNRLVWRTHHYHNMKEVDPKLPPPFDQGNLYQADMRKIGTEIITRLSENHYIVEVKPTKQETSLINKANQAALFINSGLALMEEREGLNIQRELGYGQVTQGIAWLHWQQADHIWPPVPEDEILETVPDNEDADDYDAYKSPDLQPGDMADMAVPTQYKLKPKKFLERRQEDIAKAGFPWYVECPTGDSIMWIADKSLSNGLGCVIQAREVPVFDYVQKLQDEKIYLSLNEQNSKILIYTEEDAPPQWAPSSVMMSQFVRIYNVWFRDECYELACMSQSSSITSADGCEIVKSYKHPYKMPPFALVPAIENNQQDHVLRYEPLLQGMYQVKPYLDRAQSLLDVIVEMIALPRYYLKRIDGESSLLDETGKVAFTAEAAQAMKVPDGYEIARLEFELSDSFIARVQQLRDDFDAAAPPSGQAEVGASTQPWAIRLQQAMASIQIAQMLRNQTLALNTMVRNMLMVHGIKTKEEGGFGEAAAVFAKGTRALVGIQPGDVETLDCSVTINSTSAAEKISNIQFGREMLNDPNVPLTKEKFLRDYMEDPDPEDTILAFEAQQIFEQFIKPQVLAQEVAAVYGSRVVLGPGGEMIGPGGQPMSPEDVMAQQQPQQAPPPGYGAGTMPDLNALTPPNTSPLTGMPG